MARLACARADLARKKKAIECSIDREADLEEALQQNVAERQQLLAEVAALADGNYDEIDSAKPNVEDLEAKIASLEAKLEAKEQEMAEAWQRELAAEKSLILLLAQGAGDYNDPYEARDMVRLMATAERPENDLDISGPWSLDHSAALDSRRQTWNPPARTEDGV
jgi:septal ring factor EnvC (AmiA/AmiB activator)